MKECVNIVLMGFMGTGKTSVGRQLAETLEMRFVDMDDVIEERRGKPISRIFEQEGEAFFRGLERNLVRELSIDAGLVIATGGGVVLNPDNVEDYGRTGMIVCLSASPETILERVAAETHRPLLAGDEKRESILRILAARRELYAALPHQVDTTELTIPEVVDRILGLWRAQGSAA